MRIQSERGHSVCETGHYKIIRHPRYFSSILSTIGFPLLMGFLWSSVSAFLSIILSASRTSLEDKTLKEELDGYESYSQKTRFRLIPYICRVFKATLNYKKKPVTSLNGKAIAHMGGMA